MWSRTLFATTWTWLSSIALANWPLPARVKFESVVVHGVALVVALVIASASLLAAQTPLEPAHPPAYYTLDEILNRKAELSDPAGIHDYSEYLIAAMVPDRAGKVYIDSLSDRLATAEQMARQGKGHLVPEGDVVRAYNRLLKRIGAPSSFKARETYLRSFRAHSVDVSVLPALLTANRNGTSCNPGESVYLLLMLLHGNGKIPSNYLDGLTMLGRDDDLQSQVVAAKSGSMYDYAQGRLKIYSLQHNSRAMFKLFDEVASSFGF